MNNREKRQQKKKGVTGTSELAALIEAGKQRAMPKFKEPEQLVSDDIWEKPY